MKNCIEVYHPTGHISGEITLDGSKSISNRVLIIKALMPENINIIGLSTSDDTRLLAQALNQDGSEVYDVGHAGTAYRFLTAYLATLSGTQILTGSSRMKERPIGPLVDALRSLGANIDYIGTEGFPPLRIHESDYFGIHPKVSIDPSISSQYLTALLLIAPTLPKGLRLEWKGQLVSESYLNLTLRIMEEFGIDYEKTDWYISIPHQSYHPRPYKIEADWSGCSYYYAMTSLANSAELNIHGLFAESAQGDAAIVKFAEDLGVNSTFHKDVLTISKSSPSPVFEYHFLNQPDLAQTISVLTSALGIKSRFSGLKTLRIKETDRIAALDHELAKLGGGLRLIEVVNDEEYYEVLPLEIPHQPPLFETYDDHRMAMALAPLGIRFPIKIKHPEVVSKSYPNYWKDMEKLGFNIRTVTAD